MTEEPFDLRLQLLDRQVVDGDGGLICKVDDVEFDRDPDGSWHVVALLSGPQALGRRLPGRLGRWGLAAGSRRAPPPLGRAVIAVGRRLSLHPDVAPRRIPFERVTDIGSAVTVDRARDQLD